MCGAPSLLECRGYVYKSFISKICKALLFLRISRLDTILYMPLIKKNLVNQSSKFFSTRIIALKYYKSVNSKHFSVLAFSNPLVSALSRLEIALR